MTNLLVPTEIDQTVALDWLRYSLGQGEIISPAVLRSIEGRKGRAYALAPNRADSERLATPRWGGLITLEMGSPHEALAQVFATLCERGASCVVVEDSLGLRRDPDPSSKGLMLTAFVGEKVIHWADLAGSMEDAVVVVRRGSGSYPTNAFVASVPADQLGLVDGADLSLDIADLVVESLVAVIVTAYDAETYMIWEPA